MDSYKTRDLDIASYLHSRGNTDWVCECSEHRGKKIITFVFFGDARAFDAIVEQYLNSEEYKLMEAYKLIKKAMWNAKENCNREFVHEGSDDDYDNAKQDGLL